MENENKARHQVEASSRENEQRYRALFEQTTDAVFLVTLDGVHLAVNQQAADMLGYTVEEMVGMPANQVVAPDELDDAMGRLARIRRGEKLPPYERTLIRKDGSTVSVEISIVLVRDDQGNPSHIQSVARNINKRKRAERVLHTLNQASLAMRTASTPNDVFVAAGQELKNLGFDYIVFSVNDDLSEATTQYYSYDSKAIALAAKLLGVNPANYKIKVDDVEVVRQAIREQKTVFIANARESIRQVLPQKLNDIPEQVIQLLRVPRAINAPLVVNERVLGMLSVQSPDLTQDDVPLITAFALQMAAAWHQAQLLQDLKHSLEVQRQTEDALRKSEEQFRSIFENAVMGLYRSTPDGKVLMANPATVRMLGYETIEQLRSLNAAHELYVNPEDRQKFIEAIEKDGVVTDLEAAWKRRDGSILYVRENSKAVRDSSGQTLYYEGTIEDITERKIIEQERQTLMEFQRVVAELSARFINLSIDEIESAIEQALRVVTRYTDADAASVWMFDTEQRIGGKVFGWPENKKTANNQNVPFSRFPWIFQQILDGKSITLPNPGGGLSPESKRFLSTFDIHAILAVPLAREGNILGSLSVFTRRRDKVWTQDLETLLKIVGNIIVNALERKQAEENIRALNEELEERVIQRTQQLEAANQELEAFAYSVSHDLRAPLRAIDGFSLALIEDYRDQLDEGAVAYLNRVRAASQRMGELIDDLLKLSRVTRSEMTHHTIDLSALVTEIAAELQELDPARKVTFHIQPGIIASGDRQLLRVMLTNLLNNAWKFTSKKKQAVIEFGVLEEDANTPVYFVRDNGAGFNMAYADKLFGTFQRLHSAYEFEGTGIGLATVKRIVLRHGGRIWAEGEVGRGATFYFTLGEML